MEHYNPTRDDKTVTPRALGGVLVIALLVLTASYGVLSTFGFTPEADGGDAQLSAVGLLASGQTTTKEMPTRISIPTQNLNVAVANPATTDASVLDAELRKGAVRYPGSGLLGQKDGNVVIFAHSSYLPVVHNQAYKAFNSIQNLKEGDAIYVTGSKRTYVYTVKGVYKADANTANVPLSVTENTLTLITCDSFATKSDRYVVTATLVESYLNTN